MEPKVIPGGLAVDNRGQLAYLNEMPFTVKRMYQVKNHLHGFIRAWHGHNQEMKMLFVTQGAALVQAISIPKLVSHAERANFYFSGKDLHQFVLSAAKPQALVIPGGYFNGFRTLTQDTSVMFFSNKTLEESEGDDIRRSWDALGSDIWDIEYR